MKFSSGAVSWPWSSKFAPRVLKLSPFTSKFVPWLRRSYSLAPSHVPLIRRSEISPGAGAVELSSGAGDVELSSGAVELFPGSTELASDSAYLRYPSIQMMQ